MFFRAHGSAPWVIISDEEKAVQAAISYLRELGEFTGEHYFDGYHILHNIYRKLNKKADIHYFVDLIKAKNKA